MDANHDGRVDFSEAENYLTTHSYSTFDSVKFFTEIRRMDLDNNGVITPDEFDVDLKWVSISSTVLLIELFFNLHVLITLENFLSIFWYTILILS